nr:unnamed protein product [Callosobruchus analis]
MSPFGSHALPLNLQIRAHPPVGQFIFLLRKLTAPKSMAEEVEVIEAIPGSEEKEHKTENESKIDQMALESLEEQDQPPKKLAYSGSPHRTQNLPPRNNHNYNHKPFGLQKNNKPFEARALTMVLLLLPPRKPWTNTEQHREEATSGRHLYQTCPR